MHWKITKEAHAGLSEELQKEYTIEGDSATLKLEGEGAPSTAAVAKAEDKLRIEKEHRKNAETARDAAEANSEKFRNDLDKAGGKEEITRIKQEHQVELEKIRTEREAEQTANKEAKNSALKKETARAFTAEHFTEEEIMGNAFAKRLSVEEINGEPVVRVLDKDGKASALSINELKQEFLDNPKLSGIIKTQAGSGGGANPSSGGGAATKQLSEMTGTEESAFANANPEAYAAMQA